jgi:two-component system, OmpR family, alkaline phosphatase synthesis response regulator PhoP
MAHILVVEDEEHLAVGIKFNLEAEGHVVTVASDGQAALEQLAALTPQPVELVLLDIMLPGMSGYAVCEAIRQAGNSLPVVMLTARTLVEDRIRGFDAGTDVYLQKPFDLEELLSVVRNLLARRNHRPAAENSRDERPDNLTEGRERASDVVYRFGSAEVNFDTWEVHVRGEPVRLTNLEMKLLKYLVEHAGRVVPRKELLENVWGLTRGPATRTVDTFMLALRKYFEEDPSKPIHFLSVRGTGYRFVGDPAAGPSSS